MSSRAERGEERISGALQAACAIGAHSDEEASFGETEGREGKSGVSLEWVHGGWYQSEWSTQILEKSLDHHFEMAWDWDWARKVERILLTRQGHGRDDFSAVQGMPAWVWVVWCWVIGGGSSLSMKRQRDGAVPRGAKLKQRQVLSGGSGGGGVRCGESGLSDLGW